MKVVKALEGGVSPEASATCEAVDQHVVMVHQRHEIYDNEQLDNAVPATSGQATSQLVLRLRGGKGGFGSNLRAAGKQKLTDNFDACRDLQGRRIRHKTAAQKLVDWQAEAQERELEKVALKHMREAAKAEKRTQEAEVDVQGVRIEAAATLAGVNDAVHFAVRSAPAAAAKAAEAALHAPAGKRRRIDPLLLGSEDEVSDSEGSDSDEPEEEGQPQGDAVLLGATTAGAADGEGPGKKS